MSEAKSLEQTSIKPTMGHKSGRRASDVSFPRHSLNDALLVPGAIWKHNAGKPFAVGDIADKLGYSPASSNVKSTLRAAYKYGLTTGSWSQKVTITVGISELGMSIVAPKAGENPTTHMLDALLTPKIFHDFLKSIDGGVIPSKGVCKNTLIREHHVLADDAEAGYSILMKNIDELGATMTTPQGVKYLRLDKVRVSTPAQSEKTLIEQELMEDEPVMTSSSTGQNFSNNSSEPKTKRIFVAHGKDTKPLDQLENILRQFKVNYTTAVSEPNAGQPVSEKVATLMKESTSGIFIFTADERTTDEEGNEVWRPSQNVVFELGAASVLYGKKIVILKEEDVSFASNFNDLAYIPFKKDHLGDKTANLMLELIALGFIQITPT